MNNKIIILVMSDGEDSSISAKNEFLITQKITASLLGNIAVHNLSSKLRAHPVQEMKESEQIIDSFLDTSSNLEKIYIFTDSFIVFQFFRVMVKEKRLTHDQLEIQWFELRNDVEVTSEILQVDPNGRMPYWPDKLFITQDLLMTRIL